MRRKSENIIYITWGPYVVDLGFTTEGAGATLFSFNMGEILAPSLRGGGQEGAMGQWYWGRKRIATAAAVITGYLNKKKIN